MFFVQIFIFLYPLLTVIASAIPMINFLILLIQMFLSFYLGLYLSIEQTKQKKTRQSKKIHFLIIIFLAINIVSCIRSVYSGELLVNHVIFRAIQLIFFYLVGLFALKLQKQDKIISSLYLGILFYGVIDIFLLNSPIFVLRTQSVVLFDNESIGSINSIASLFGFQSERVLFPLASFSWGATHLGSIMGIIYVASCINLIYIRLGNKETISEYVFRIAVYLVSIVVSFYIIMLSDSRAAFIASVISVLTFLILRLLFIQPSLVKRLLKYIPQFFLSFYLFSFAYAYTKEFLSYILETAHLYRGDNTNTFSSREIIWDSVLKFFSEFSPEHIIGYGVWGQYAAGINRTYEALLFSGYSSNRFSLHSTILQQLIGIGYLGIFVYIFLTLLVLKSSRTIFLKTMFYNSDYPQLNYTIFSSWNNLGVLFYLIIVGASDPVITMERSFSMNIYLVIAMCSLTLLQKQDLRSRNSYV
jgi:hypothetical protein